MRRSEGSSRSGHAASRHGQRRGRRDASSYDRRRAGDAHPTRRDTGTGHTHPATSRGGRGYRPPAGRPAAWQAAIVPPALALGAAAVLSLAAYAGQVVFALALLLLQAYLVLLWEQVTRPVHPQGVRVIAGAAALGADAAVVVASRGEPTVGPAAAVTGLVVVAALVQQILRRDGRADVLGSVTATATLGALVSLAAGVLAAQATPAGAALVACATGGSALGVTALTLRAWHVPRLVATPVSLALASGLGYLVGATSIVIGPVRGAVVGVVGALVTTATLAVAARPPGPEPADRPPAREQNMLAAVLSLVIACSLAYVLGRLVVS